jgi:hypothetical protein
MILGFYPSALCFSPDLSDSINEIRDFFDGLSSREFALENYVALRLSFDGVQLTNMSNHYATAGTFQD